MDKLLKNVNKYIMPEMAIEYGHERPELRLQNRTQAQNIWRERVLFSGRPENDLDRFATRLIAVAEKMGPRICKLKGNEGTEGFMIGFSANEATSPTLTVQIGTIEIADDNYGADGKRGKYPEFIDLKTASIKTNPGFISSAENLSLPEKWQLKSTGGIAIPGGAIAVGENNQYIVAVSAFKNAQMDAAVSLAMAVGAGIISMHEAIKLSQDKRINCKKEFLDSGLQDILIEEVMH